MNEAQVEARAFRDRIVKYVQSRLADGEPPKAIAFIAVPGDRIATAQIAQVLQTQPHDKVADELRGFAAREAAKWSLLVLPAMTTVAELPGRQSVALFFLEVRGEPAERTVAVFDATMRSVVRYGPLIQRDDSTAKFTDILGPPRFLN